MTLQQLEYVVSLDTYRHYVKAAEHCMVSQPNLTMQVKKLEEEIGMQLFDRDKKPLQPTKSAELFIEKARSIIEEVNQLKAYVSMEIEQVEGHFEIGIIPTLAPYLLPKFLPNFFQQFGEVDMKIQELPTAELIEALNKDQIDAGLLVTPLELSHIREIPLFYEPFWLYAPKGHKTRKKKKLVPENITEDDLLILEDGHCFRQQTLSICSKSSASDAKKFTYQSGSIEALKAFVKEGMGFTLIPEMAINDLDKDWVQEFHSPKPAREVSLVVRKSFSKEAFIEAVRDVIQSHLPAHFNKPTHYTRVKWK